MHHYARVIELIYALERARQLVTDPEILRNAEPRIRGMSSMSKFSLHSSTSKSPFKVKPMVYLLKTKMRQKVKGWVFPKPDGGGVTVAKTYVFTPQT